MINVYIDFGRIIPVILGTFLGFLLGLITLYIKEVIDYKKKKSVFRFNAIYVINNIKRYLHEDPDLCSSVDVSTLSSYIYEGLADKGIVELFYEVFGIYMDWKRGFYMPEKPGSLRITQVKNRLDEIIRLIDNGRS